MSAVTITGEHRAALAALASNPSGPIARELEFVAHNDVYWIVKDALDQPSSFSTTERGWHVWQVNEPPGPPLSRTGRLWDSVRVDRPKRDAQGVHVDITVQSTPRAVADAKGNVHFDNFDYVNKLIQDGYIFVHKGDNRFKILERGPGQ